MGNLLVDSEVLDALRLLLVFGFVFVFVLLLFDLTSKLESKSPPGVSVGQLPARGEECKLHSRKLSECMRLGMHSPASDDEVPKEEGPDDPAG